MKRGRCKRTLQDISLYLCIGVITLFFILAIIPEVFAPFPENKRFIPYMDPDTVHFLGTDDMGYDIFSLLIYAARISLLIGFCAGGFSIFIGTATGLVSGYFRGWIDDLLMALTDIVLIIPKIPAIILISAFLRPSIWILILILGFFSWETTARVVRARTLQMSTSGHVLSARSLGFSSYQILISDIVPVIFPVLLPKFMLTITGAMISEASLSFLGLSDPTMNSWGRMISDAFTHGGFIREMWWWFLPPAICISGAIISFIRIGMVYEKPGQETMVE
ncbi:MAG TPA: ABC transporter permease [Methanospirillum sp.]|uniref:ABC transporter permease n=1 Tax=Methanospirillum sp. TaxID=45200 RepID=UPI002CCCDCFF|nr:ABC transporter permease [Methanospirillum sp.]HOJ97494.1 ABC transporter permease [Methanospirillum sp.]